jgi:arsenite methyltransferase
MNRQPTSESNSTTIDVEHVVAERYSAASQAVEPSLCCPVQYDATYLKVLPQELIDRDYGCGNPAEYLGRDQGETVLDLGAGGGKICYIASQIVGRRGRVLGVDMNQDMLNLARGHQAEVSRRIGWDNVHFFKGRIQDLALDLDRFEAYLGQHPVTTSADWLAAQREADRMRREEPMVANDSVDVVLSNCVLNLVTPADRQSLFDEIHRVLKRGGRAVISDVVCDEPVPLHLQQDAKLWSGCLSGAFVEHEFLQAFERAGLHGIEIVSRQEQPWAVVEGIEFRSLTVRAFKGKDGPCRDHNQAVIYTGPWKSVTDDEGHVLHRGQRMAVCRKNFELYCREPYAGSILPVEPAQPVSDEQATPFDCHQGKVRSPKDTKRGGARETSLPVADCCGPESCC